MMSAQECPTCGHLMDYQGEESDVGVVGGFFCDSCGQTADEDYAPIGDEVI